MNIQQYEPIVGIPVIGQLRRLGERLKGLRVVHVNSTAEGGGVAEILAWMVPLMNDLGLDAHWRGHLGDERILLRDQGDSQRSSGLFRPAQEARLGRLPGCEPGKCQVAEGRTRRGGHRRHPRPAAGAPAGALHPAAGTVDLALPHRCQPPVPIGLEGAQTLRGEIRREHLLHVPVRPAAAPSPVSHRAEHRPAERKEHRSRRP